ncbi:hypothetical protein OKW42_001040 [Paraburkholderia sp. WC7.3d]
MLLIGKTLPPSARKVQFINPLLRFTFETAQPF